MSEKIKTAYDVAVERTAHIAPAEPRKPYVPPEPPSTFGEWIGQNGHVATNEYGDDSSILKSYFEDCWNAAVEACMTLLYDPTLWKWEYVAGVAWQSDGCEVLGVEKTMKSLEAAMHALAGNKKETRAIAE